MTALSSILGGGGKYRFQEFKTSGTFTPSAALLAAGGNIRVSKLVGAGGGGKYSAAPRQDGYGGGGEVLSFPYNVTTTDPIAVTIGLGGVGAGGPDSASAGGNSSFGPIVARGGKPGSADSAGYGGASGSGCRGSGASNPAWGGGAAGSGAAAGPGIDGYGIGSNGSNPAIPNSGNGGGGGISGADGYCLVEWFEQ